MKSKYQKDLKMLMRKNEDRCSICKVPFDDTGIVFTCMGYDKHRKLQSTTGCCFHEIINLKSIGVCGSFNPDEFNEILSEHPLFEEYTKKSNEILTTIQKAAMN